MAQDLAERTDKANQKLNDFLDNFMEKEAEAVDKIDEMRWNEVDIDSFVLRRMMPHMMQKNETCDEYIDSIRTNAKAGKDGAIVWCEDDLSKCYWNTENQLGLEYSTVDEFDYIPPLYAIGGATYEKYCGEEGQALLKKLRTPTQMPKQQAVGSRVNLDKKRRKQAAEKLALFSVKGSEAAQSASSSERSTNYMAFGAGALSASAAVALGLYLVKRSKQTADEEDEGFHRV